MPATKAIRISNSFNPGEIDVFAEIVTAAQRGAAITISDTKSFQSLAVKVAQMRTKVAKKKAAAGSA